MAPNDIKIFLKEVDKIKGNIEQREDIEDIIEMYQDVKKTKQDIMDSFFLNLGAQEKTKYERALQDVVKKSIGEELFQELIKEKSRHHGTKDEGLTGGNYYKSLVADKGEEEVQKIYRENAKKGVEAKGLIPRSDKEKDYIIQHKLLGIMTNNEIADACNTQFNDINKGNRTGEKVAQWYYKYNQKLNKINLLDNDK